LLNYKDVIHTRRVCVMGADPTGVAVFSPAMPVDAPKSLPQGTVGSSGGAGTAIDGASAPPSISNTLPVTHEEASDTR
jgi:hypothetical protein